MDERLDTVAKRLATGGLSRRGALRGVAGAFGASLLAYVGIGCAPEAGLSAPGARRGEAPLEPDGPGPEANPGTAAATCSVAAYQACVGRAEVGYADALPACRTDRYTAAQTATCETRAAAKRTADVQLCTVRAGCASGTDVCTSTGVCAAAGPAPAAVDGTWTGTATLGTETIRLQFVLTVTGATLGGTARFWEPLRALYVDVGALTGTFNGTAARWELPSPGGIAGTFGGDADAGFTRFAGTLTFAPAPGTPALTAVVELTR